MAWFSQKTRYITDQVYYVHERLPIYVCVTHDKPGRVSLGVVHLRDGNSRSSFLQIAAGRGRFAIASKFIQVIYGDVICAGLAASEDCGTAFEELFRGAGLDAKSIMAACKAGALTSAGWRRGSFADTLKLNPES